MEGCQMLVLLCVLLASLVCDFPSSIFCKAGFVATYCLNLFFSLNILFFPSMVNARFADIVVWACIHGLLVSAAHLFKTFWLSWFPLRSQV